MSALRRSSIRLLKSQETSTREPLPVHVMRYQVLQYKVIGNKWKHTADSIAYILTES